MTTHPFAGAEGHVMPGFVDIQVNGAYGHDFTTDPGSIWEVARLLPRHGVTAFLPTVISSPVEVAEAALAVVAAGPPPGFAGAMPLGVHVEGPVISPRRRGTHPAEALQEPSLQWAERLIAAGPPKMVTIAPELPGAEAVVRRLMEAGVVVAIGHSDATAEQAQAAFGWGLRHATHLFNAMSGLDHRAPGVAAAILADDRVTCGLIADGAYVADTMLRLAWRALGPTRIALVTDAMAPLLADGEYRIGTVDVTVTDGVVRNRDGALAGSAATLDRVVAVMRRATGCSSDGSPPWPRRPVGHRRAPPRSGRRRPGRRRPGGGGDGDRRRGGVGEAGVSLIGEIEEQPAAVARMLEGNAGIVAELAALAEGVTHVVVAARGTSDNAARYAQYVWGARNRLVVSLTTPALFGPLESPPDLTGALVVGISQSGQSPDLVEVLAEANRQNRPTLAITNDPSSPLASQARCVLDLCAGSERAIAATRPTRPSWRRWLWSAWRSPATTRAAWPSSRLCCGRPWTAPPPLARRRGMLADADRCVVVGRGYHIATAFEWALKLEMAMSSPSRFGRRLPARAGGGGEGVPVLVVATAGPTFEQMASLASDMQQKAWR